MNGAMLMLAAAIVGPIAVFEVRRKWRGWRDANSHRVSRSSFARSDTPVWSGVDMSSSRDFTVGVGADGVVHEVIHYSAADHCASGTSDNISTDTASDTGDCGGGE